MSIWVDETLSTWKSKLFSVIVQLLILINVLAIILETEQVIADSAPPDFFFVLDVTCSGLFTLEIIVRLWASKSICSYLGETMNVIDLVSVLPFYIGLLLAVVES